MDKKIFGIVGAMAFAPVAGIAAPMPVQHEPVTVGSFADLLSPIPNATEKLVASDAVAANRPAARVEKVRYHHHHHHHHHHSVIRRLLGGGFHRHHHHHHHHHHFHHGDRF